jgi:hypothetical protein
MTLEINEIGIRMNVRGDSAPQSPPKTYQQDGCGDVDREQIVEDCTRRVLRILENQRQR